MKNMKNISVIRYDSDKNIFLKDEKLTSIEISLDIFLNGEFFKKIFCSPNDIEDLIIGILAQSQKINSIDDIMSIEIENSTAKVKTKINQTQNKNQKKIPENIKFKAKNILKCADELLKNLSKTHEITKGVHSGVIFDGEKILIYREDIGRHNVFDKLFGWSLKNNIDLSDKIIIYSGRCSSEMMKKLIRMKIFAVAAKSVPTTFSIELAEKFGITLIARMSANSFCIYTWSEKIIL